MQDYITDGWRQATDGSKGIWLGIGLGTATMDGADIIHCEYIFFNSDLKKGKFTCYDRYSSGHSFPPLDKKRDTVDVSSDFWFTAEPQANFVAEFDRPCITNDD
jgi:hypothetical protein